jgi:hypothetical protein
MENKLRIKTPVVKKSHFKKQSQFGTIFKQARK